MDSIIVVGGGIAGLTFGIAASRYLKEHGQHNVKITVLERGTKDDVDRKSAYSHSLSIRTDVDGVGVLRELGLMDQLQKLTTPTLGFYIAYLPPKQQAKLVAISDWFIKMEQRGMRLLRFDLWQELRAAAVAEGVDIQYGIRVESVSLDGPSICIKTADGQQVDTRNVKLLVSCDGVRSAVRQSLLPEEKLNFLKTVIAGATLAISPTDDVWKKLPDFMIQHHGILCGPGSTSMFMADEGQGKFLVSVAFPNDTPLSRDALSTDDALRQRVLDIAASYPAPFDNLIRRVVDSATSPRSPSEEAYMVSCNDKLPTPPIDGRIVFLGDASSPVSPFSGAGANKALIDGLRLAKALFANKNDAVISDPSVLSRTVNAFFEETKKMHVEVLHQQRTNIAVFHCNSWKRTPRNWLFDFLPHVVHPQKRRALLYKAMAVATAGVAAAVYYWKH